MTEQGQSKCQICGGMCEMTDIGTKGEGWEHINSANSGHPPFPAMENTKKEALEEYRKWQREFKQKGDEEMFLVKLQEQNRIVIPQAVAEVLKVKKGDKIRITAEKVD